MSARYPWLLLDADGTIFDYDAAEEAALGAALGEVGLRLDPRVRTRYRQISAVLWKRFEQGEISAERLRVERFELLLDGGARAADAARLAERYVELLARQTQLLPGAREVVAELAERCRLVLATNGLSTVQRSRLALSGLEAAFEAVVISEEIGCPKPHRGYYEEAFRRMAGPSRRDVLMVGDSLSSDIAGGREAGIDTCWFAEEEAPDPEPPPTFRIARLAELPAIAFG